MEPEGNLSTRRLIWVAVGTLTLLCFPTEGFAWGPATHVGLGRSVLDQLGLLPAGIAAILARYSWSYLYGCIAADMVFAKRLSRVKQFCHHWSTAFRLLETAKTDSGRSFAYGYLSHLAADTVAHGKFVPRQIVVSGSTIQFGHLYWELRADAAVEQPAREDLATTVSCNHTEHHEVLRDHLRGTFLSFGWNRIIFARMNVLALHEGFGQTINLCGRYSRWPLSTELLAAYRSECIDRTISVLTEGSRSAMLREDPNGTSALLQAQIHRKTVRRMRTHGLAVHHRVREAAHALLPCPIQARTERVASAAKA